MTTPFPVNGFNVTSADAETNSRVAVLANGNIAVVYFGDAVAGEIRVSLHAPDGTDLNPVDTVIGVPVNAGFLGSVDSRPEIAALADGRFVIVGTNDAHFNDPSFGVYSESGVPQSGGLSSMSDHVEDDAFVFGLVDGNFVSVF